MASEISGFLALRSRDDGVQYHRLWFRGGKKGETGADGDWVTEGKGRGCHLQKSVSR